VVAGVVAGFVVGDGRDKGGRVADLLGEAFFSGGDEPILNFKSCMDPKGPMFPDDIDTGATLSVVGVVPGGSRTT
jgi:hypothetical protein